MAKNGVVLELKDSAGTENIKPSSLSPQHTNYDSLKEVNADNGRLCPHIGKHCII